MKNRYETLFLKDLPNEKGSFIFKFLDLALFCYLLQMAAKLKANLEMNYFLAF